MQWTWVWVGSRSWWWTGKPGVLQLMGLQSRTQLSDWTELKRESVLKTLCWMTETLYKRIHVLWFQLYKGLYNRENYCMVGTKFRDGNGNPLQYSCLDNPMGRGAWQAAVYGVVKSRTQLSNFTFTFHFHSLEKEMAAPSSVLAWRIPGMEEPGRLPFMASHRVRHDWSDLAVASSRHKISSCLWRDRGGTKKEPEGNF